MIRSRCKHYLFCLPNKYIPFIYILYSILRNVFDNLMARGKKKSNDFWHVVLEKFVIPDIDDVNVAAY